FFFSSRRRHTRFSRDWSSDVCSSDLGDIVLVKAHWDLRYSHRTAEFWTQAPYMTAEAARWLLEKQVQAVVFDFPQDYVIRLLLRSEEHTSELQSRENLVCRLLLEKKK